MAALCDGLDALCPRCAAPTALGVVADAFPGCSLLDARAVGCDCGWALSVEPFDEADFGLVEGDAVPDISLDPEDLVLSVINAARTPRAYHVSLRNCRALGQLGSDGEALAPLPSKRCGDDDVATFSLVRFFFLTIRPLGRRARFFRRPSARGRGSTFASWTRSTSRPSTSPPTSSTSSRRRRDSRRPRRATDSPSAAAGPSSARAFSRRFLFLYRARPRRNVLRSSQAGRGRPPVALRARVDVLRRGLPVPRGHAGPRDRRRRRRRRPVRRTRVFDSRFGALQMERHRPPPRRRRARRARFPGAAEERFASFI